MITMMIAYIRFVLAMYYILLQALYMNYLILQQPCGIDIVIPMVQIAMQDRVIQILSAH